MFSKCIKCEFHVTETDEYCLNCGLKNPTSEISTLKEWFLPFLILIWMFGFILIFLVVFSLFSNPLSETDILFSLLIIFFLSLPHTFVLYYLLYIPYKKKADERNIYSQNNLIEKDKIISKRISSLSQRWNNLETVLKKINENPSGNLQTVEQKLLSAKEIVNNQLFRYGLQKEKIKLVRLQNKIFPYLSEMKGLIDFQIENGIVESKQVMSEIKIISQKFSGDIIHSSKSEQIDFLDHLEETYLSCSNLKDNLISKQALDVLKTIQPLEEVNQNTQTKDFSHDIETFNIQTSLTDFSESFEQLESEYNRLLADNSINEKLLKL